MMEILLCVKLSLECQAIGRFWLTINFKNMKSSMNQKSKAKLSKILLQSNLRCLMEILMLLAKRISKIDFQRNNLGYHLQPTRTVNFNLQSSFLSYQQRFKKSTKKISAMKRSASTSNEKITYRMYRTSKS